MLRLILMDELHVRVAVAATATAADRTAIRRLLAGPSFRRQLVRAVRALLAGLPAARVRLAR